MLRRCILLEGDHSFQKGSKPLPKHLQSVKYAKSPLHPFDWVFDWKSAVTHLKENRTVRMEQAVDLGQSGIQAPWYTCRKSVTASIPRRSNVNEV